MDNKFSHTGHFFTPDQFLAFLEGQNCCKCEKKATWIPMEKGLGYCDEHYPYEPLSPTECGDPHAIDSPGVENVLE